MMMTKSNLPLDLTEDILSRVPITSLKALKFTCKEWNSLSKDPIFKEKHCRKAAKEVMMIMVDTFKLRLMEINLHSIDNHSDLVDPFTNHKGKHNQEVKISQVFHCNGLLLCVDRNNSRLMVWNPYLSQIRWIQPTKPYPSGYDPYFYVMGYDNNKHHKILRFCNWYEPFNYEIYDFMSNSWRDLSLNRCIRDCGVSLKGNNYFIDLDYCLRCFDFTRERFEDLPLPYDSSFVEYVVLSVVKEEQLAMLRSDLFETQIWITTRIEPTSVSWRSLIKVDMNINKCPYEFKSFSVVEEKKKVAVICYAEFYSHKACLIQEDGYYKELCFGKSTDQMITCSYVPSSMWIL